MKILPWRVFSFCRFTHTQHPSQAWTAFSWSIQLLQECPLWPTFLEQFLFANQQVLSKQGHISGHWTPQLAKGKFGKASGLPTKMEIPKKKKKVQLLKWNFNCVRLILCKSTSSGTKRHWLCTKGWETKIARAAKRIIWLGQMLNTETNIM